MSSVTETVPDVESSDVESSDVGSSDVESSDVESSDVEFSDIESSDAESSDEESSDEESSDVESSDEESSDYDFSEVKLDDDSSFGCLPDDIVSIILNKLIDLRTLCLCKLVCFRFYLISHLVHTVSFTAPSDPKFDKCVYKSLKKFRRLKSLSIELPPTTKAVDPRYFFKWKIHMDKKFNSYVFLLANAVCDLQETFPKDNVQDAKEEDKKDFCNVISKKQKRQVAADCLMDAGYRRRLVLHFIRRFPLLENVSIKDTGKRGRISLSREKIVELRNWICSDPETANEKMKDIGTPRALNYCYVPFLELPACGYMMEGVSFILLEVGDDNDDSFMRFNLDDFEDREEAAYSEAGMKIFTEHRGRRGWRRMAGAW